MSSFYVKNATKKSMESKEDNREVEAFYLGRLARALRIFDMTDRHGAIDLQKVSNTKAELSQTFKESGFDIPALVERYLKEKNFKMSSSKDKIVLMSKFSPVPYATTLMQEFKFLYDKYKRFWRYEEKEGIWKEDAEEIIRQRLRVELMGEEQQKNNYAQEVISYIRDVSYSSAKQTELDEDIIPFQNCLFDIVQEKFIDFSPNYFVTNKVPVEIDSNFQDCSIIDGFFGDCVKEEYKEILYDLFAHCLYRGQPYQKLFFLYGGGLNGKSTCLELLREFLGQDNVSSVSPHDICGQNRFALGNLWNKYANISSDISYEVLQNVNKIKEITGGDTINVERKFKEGFPAKLYAKQIFSTNQLPMVNDKTDAWYRRIYLIEFPNKIQNPDRNLLKKLITKEQLMGLAWQCVKRLKDMKNRGWSFSFDIDVDKLSQSYEDLSNPLSKFLRENTEEDFYGSIWKFEFKERFEQWLKDNKLRLWNDTELGIEMKYRYSDGKKIYSKPLEPEKRYWAWEGLKWSFGKGSLGVKGFNISSIYVRRSYNTPVTLDGMDGLLQSSVSREEI